MKTSYDELYAKLPDTIGRPVRVANPDPLHNNTKISDNGTYDVSSFAVAKIDVEGGGGSGDSAIIVHAVYNETSETWHLDKTNEELYALFEEGKPIFVEREETYEVNGFTCAYKGLGQIINAEYITGDDEGTEIEEWKFYPSSGYNDHFYGYWRGIRSDLPPYWVDD